MRSSTSTSDIVSPAATSHSNLDKANTIATPSRTWAARIPSSSASFLIPLARAIGDVFETRLRTRGCRGEPREPRVLSEAVHDDRKTYNVIKKMNYLTSRMKTATLKDLDASLQAARFRECKMSTRVGELIETPVLRYHVHKRIVDPIWVNPHSLPLVHQRPHCG